MLYSISLKSRMKRSQTSRISSFVPSKNGSYTPMTVMPLALALRQDLTESSKKMHSCGETPSSSVA